jgi:ribosomal protein S24E
VSDRYKALKGEYQLFVKVGGKMKVIIVNEKDNPHMGRKELILLVEHIAGATPSLAGLQEFLSRDWGIEPERIEIKNIFSLRKPASRVKVYVWNVPKVPFLKEKKTE